MKEKKKYVEEKIQDFTKEIQYAEPEYITSSFVEIFKNYMDENKNEDKNILKLIYNLIEDEEIKAYFEGTFDESKIENKEELEEIICEIFTEIKKTHLYKIDKLKSYTNKTKEIYNEIIDRTFDNFLNYYFQKLEKQTKKLEDYNIVDYFNLYNNFMEKDKNLPNLVIIDSNTLKLEESLVFDKIDPTRKCIVLFYFQNSNEYERIIYESYFLPPFLFAKNEDYTIKKKNNQTYYRLYTFPYDHPLIQDLR